MSKQAWVGVFTILGIVAVFAVFFVLSDFGLRSRGYKIAVHFRSASGLRSGAEVALSGVPIGAVDSISLLPDFTTDVIMSIQPGYEIPQGSRFIIQAPITGEPTVLIEPPRTTTAQTPTLPHGIAADIASQPQGTNPTSFADLLAQGQGEAKRLDDILSQLQKSEPGLLAELHSALHNANELTTNANESLASITAQAHTLTDSLQKNLTVASNNVVDLTGNLDTVVKRNSGQVDDLLSQLNRTSRSFGVTVDSLRDVATNPSVKKNLLSTAHDFAQTAHTFADLTQDLRKVTSNQQTQAQLRDTVAQIDATSQKVDSLVASLGGTSSVYGVDHGATPAPAPPSLPGGKPLPAGTALPAGAATPEPGAAVPQPSTSPPVAPNSYGVPGGMSNPAPTTPAVSNASSREAKVAALRERLNRFTKDLVQLEVRVSALTPLRPGSYSRNVSPLLTADRGLQSDFNLFVLPRGHMGLELGANDIGTTAGTTTANALLINRNTHFSYGGGVEYSRLGVMASLAGPRLGVETRAYDLRHPTIDQYVNVFALPKGQIFVGERDLLHASRRSVLGLQFEF